MVFWSSDGMRPLAQLLVLKTENRPKEEAEAAKLFILPLSRIPGRPFQRIAAHIEIVTFSRHRERPAPVSRRDARYVREADVIRPFNFR